MRASARIGQLVDATSEHVGLHAARLLLETSGDLKSSAGGVSVNINNNIAPGYVIDYRDPRDAKLVEAEADVNNVITPDRTQAIEK